MAKWLSAGWNTVSGINYPSVWETTDGVNWSAVSTNGLPTVGIINAIEYGNGIWLAAISNTLNQADDGIWSSVDGINWGLRYQGLLTGTIDTFTYGQNVWVAGNDNGSGGGYVYFSLDNGFTWSRTFTGTQVNATDSAYGNGTFMVGMRKTLGTQTTATIWRYSVGSGWNTLNILLPSAASEASSVSGIAYYNGTWAALINTIHEVSSGVFERYSYIATSTDAGNTWSLSTPFNWGLTSQLIYGNQLWVAAGRPYDNITNSYTGPWEVAYSGDLTTWGFSAHPFTTDSIADINYGFGEYHISNISGELARSDDPVPLTFTAVAGSPVMTSISDISDSFANPADPYTDITALGDNGHTVSQDSEVYVSLLYRGTVLNAYDALDLYSVKKDYRYDSSTELVPVSPKVSDDGLPFYTNVYPAGGDPGDTFSTLPGQVPYHSETVEKWGKIAIFINNEDVTFFRGAHTIIENISWQTFGNFETCALFFPHVTVYDKLGIYTPTTTSGIGGGILDTAIPWLNDSNPVEIRRIKPDLTEETLWLGSINGIELDAIGYGARVTCSGLLYDANYQLIPGEFREAENVVAEDVGVLTARTLNSLEGGWSYAEPVNLGVSTIKVGNWDNALDYLRSLSTYSEKKLWIDTDAKPYVSGRPSTTSFDLIAGQDGINVDVSYDSNAIPTIIYGSGTLPSGVVWRNIVYPAMVGGLAGSRWPFDETVSIMERGMKDSDTVTGSGVSALRQLLALKGISGGPDQPELQLIGPYDDTVQYAVETLQSIYEIERTGTVDVNLWNKLVSDVLGVGESTINAYIAPLYISPLVDPSSPSYDPTVKKVEQFIDFGSNITVEEGKDVAEKIIMRDLIRVNTSTPAVYRPRKSVTGTIALSVCPATIARWDIKPGDRVRVWTHLFSPIPKNEHTAPSGFTTEGGNWAGSLVVYITRIEWDLSGTPTAILEVSSRDLEYSELDAAKNRKKVSNAEASRVARLTKETGRTTNNVAAGSAQARPLRANGLSAI